jgi:hypothetical protein
LFALAGVLLASLSEQGEEEEEAISLLLVMAQLVSARVPERFVLLLVLALFREPLASLEAEKEEEEKQVEVPSLAQVPEPSASPLVQVLRPELLSSLSALSAQLSQSSSPQYPFL